MIYRILILILFSSCGKIDLDSHTTYTIEKGRHSSGNRFDLLTTKDLEFTVEFDESAIYKNIIKDNQRDINKLYGFSECNQKHQDNSARFGWRWYKGSLEIHAYVYNNGIRFSKFVENINLNTQHDLKIIVNKYSYTFTVNNASVNMNRTNKCSTGAYYMLYPYFGGDEVAPHDINIIITEKRSR